jgi:hypothetical protein
MKTENILQTQAPDLHQTSELGSGIEKNLNQKIIKQLEAD